jgi:hypothetical protein
MARTEEVKSLLRSHRTVQISVELYDAAKSGNIEQLQKVLAAQHQQGAHLPVPALLLNWKNPNEVRVYLFITAVFCVGK